MFNRRRTAIAALFAVCAFFLSARTGSSHDPITTKVMFNKEVIRILQRNCLGCHAPNKIKADIPLTTYEEARPWAKAIKEEVLEKRMMPFQAVKGYGRFEHDYVLPQREIELLVSWIEGGAPRGEAKDYPKTEVAQLIKGETWPLGQPDFILQWGNDAQPISSLKLKLENEAKITAEDNVEIRCFVLPTKFKTGRSLSAIDFRPGDGTIVQSATFSIYDLPRTRTGRAIGDPVLPCVAEASSNPLGSWVPGQTSSHLPSNTAYWLPAGADIILKIHYSKGGNISADRSQLALYFSKEPISKLVRYTPITPPETTILANAENQRVQTSMVLNNEAEAVAIRPLLFPFAKSLEATAYRPDGSVEVLIVARQYRYDWQPAYQFRKPIPLPKGTRIEVTAYFDNSDNNRNNPNDPPVALQFAEPLCEIALAQDAQPKVSSVSRASRKNQRIEPRP